MNGKFVRIVRGFDIIVVLSSNFILYGKAFLKSSLLYSLILNNRTTISNKNNTNGRNLKIEGFLPDCKLLNDLN